MVLLEQNMSADKTIKLECTQRRYFIKSKLGINLLRISPFFEWEFQGLASGFGIDNIAPDKGSVRFR